MYNIYCKMANLLTAAEAQSAMNSLKETRDSEQIKEVMKIINDNLMEGYTVIQYGLYQSVITRLQDSGYKVIASKKGIMISWA